MICMIFTISLVSCVSWWSTTTKAKFRAEHTSTELLPLRSTSCICGCSSDSLSGQQTSALVQSLCALHIHFPCAVVGESLFCLTVTGTVALSSVHWLLVCHLKMLWIICITFSQSTIHSYFILTLLIAAQWHTLPLWPLLKIMWQHNVFIFGPAVETLVAICIVMFDQWSLSSKDSFCQAFLQITAFAQKIKLFQSISFSSSFS